MEICLWGRGGSRERGGVKRRFPLILKYYSILILSSSVETIKRDDTIERPDRIQNLKFIQLIVVNKLFPTLWFSGPKISKRDNATTIQDHRD